MIIPEYKFTIILPAIPLKKSDYESFVTIGARIKNAFKKLEKFKRFIQIQYYSNIARGCKRLNLVTLCKLSIKKNYEIKCCAV